MNIGISKFANEVGYCDIQELEVQNVVGEFKHRKPEYVEMDK